MVSKPVIVGVALAGVAAAAVGAYSYNRLQQQRSLAQGIAQTQQALAKVDELIAQNQSEIANLIPTVEIDLGPSLEALPQVDLPASAQNTPLGNTLDAFNAVSKGLDARSAFQNHDYMKALENAGEATATVWGALDPGISGTTVKYGAEAIDVGANLVETQALIRQQEKLLGTQATLQQQLYQLQGKDPQAGAEWQQIFNNLRGDPAAQHNAFLKWLAANGLSEKDVVAKALANAAKSGPSIASQVASGITIVDPSQASNGLSDIPGINPDFIAAMQCDNYVASHGISDPRWLKFTCAHYPDGTFIPAFGPCRGIDIPNPIYGGMISSSTAACSSNASSSHGVTPNTSNPSDTEVVRTSEGHEIIYNPIDPKVWGTAGVKGILDLAPTSPAMKLWYGTGYEKFAQDSPVTIGYVVIDSHGKSSPARSDYTKFLEPGNYSLEFKDGRILKVSPLKFQVRPDCHTQIRLHVGTIALLGFVNLPSTMFTKETGWSPCMGSTCAHDGEWLDATGHRVQKWVTTGMGQFAEPGDYVLKVPGREFHVAVHDGEVSPVYYDKSH